MNRRSKTLSAVGTALQALEQDVILPSHRDLAIFFIRGVPLGRIFAQYMGRVDGLTRGRDGMVAFDRRHKPVDIPIVGSDEVADVTGAGDTVIAAFTAALAAGATTEEAAQLANYAGGIVVMKRGTATASPEELLHALDQSPPATRPH